jgi:ubiquinone/menaquinone biosynthesis C-methylase UbiE
MPSNPAIALYYNQLAEQYDEHRFSNSYGRYLHRQEYLLLRKWLLPYPVETVADMGCGTGRLLPLAGTGIDCSEGMLAIARKKYPEKKLIRADIVSVPLPGSSFTALTYMHVFMHLEKDIIGQVMSEAWRLLKPGGVLILDFPNDLRRSMKKHTPAEADWHAATALSVNWFEEKFSDQWIVKKKAGLLLFPIHRLPVWSRSALRPIDSFLCRYFLYKLASYHLICLQKK